MALTWQDASDFLSKGRKKYERPLYDRGLRIWKTNKWDANSDINVGWKFGGNSNTFVTYHKDGTTTILGSTQHKNWGGTWTPLRSQSVRLTIFRYAGITVLQRNFKFYLEENGAPITPPKIQGCRKCAQTGLVEKFCSSTNCYSAELISNTEIKCSIHPGDITHPQYGYGSHPVPCEHGHIGWHKVPRGQKCSSCNGNKKRDYGSKPERTLWSGQPLRLRDGKIIQTNATQSALERMMADVIETVS